MRFFERHAPTLAARALEGIDIAGLKDEVTHLIVACCTGLYAPGIDIDIINQFGLKPTVERTFVGFMGCYSAVSALKLARHIVRSEPGAKVVVVNVELCTIHLQEIHDVDQMLCFLIWGDGASACLVSSEPTGIELQSFHSVMIGEGADQLVWRIGQSGFDIVLSGKVAQTLGHTLPGTIGSILGGRQGTRHRLVGGPSGRTRDTRRRRPRNRSAGRSAGPFARGAPALRQHVVGHPGLRPERNARKKAQGPRLRHGVWAGAGGGEHGVRGNGLAGPRDPGSFFPGEAAL